MQMSVLRRLRVRGEQKRFDEETREDARALARISTHEERRWTEPWFGTKKFRGVQAIARTFSLYRFHRSSDSSFVVISWAFSEKFAIENSRLTQALDNRQPMMSGVFLPMKKVRRCDLCARVSHVSRVRACPGSTPGVFEPSDGKSDQHGRDRSLGKPKGSRRGCNGDGGALA